ncbi:uncharacterized protein [Polyergus mexicanus]|uniref:uncharacterized protein n=1 Tax=Polyergus mexicanus TaxID=615972 RepID=UPI0038B62E7B
MSDKREAIKSKRSLTSSSKRVAREIKEEQDQHMCVLQFCLSHRTVFSGCCRKTIRCGFTLLFPTSFYRAAMERRRSMDMVRLVRRAANVDARGSESVTEERGLRISTGVYYLRCCTSIELLYKFEEIDVRMVERSIDGNWSAMHSTIGELNRTCRGASSN